VTELHKDLDEIILSVVTVSFRRYRKFVEKKDLTQEAYTFVYSRAESFNSLLNEPDEQQRGYHAKRIAWQIKRNLERYCRKEKASRSGYMPNDEAFYDTVTIAQLLPYVLSAIVNDTALEQAQNLINDGTPRKPSAPAEGGNLLAILIDIKKAYELLDKDEKEVLRLKYHENITLQQLAEYLECSTSTADRRVTRALYKLNNNIGGASPYNR
jgi:RNA polymerase sigma factor (sigma-70 family)